MDSASGKGVFITFEGGDGAGKSTHIKFLAEVLRTQGLEVVCVREPGGTSIGEQLRAVVLDPNNPEMAPEAELLIYEAARAQLVAEVIRPALKRGAVVLCDRFTDSTVAYQGYGRGLDVGFIRAANSFATGDLVPDRTILVYCADRGAKGDRIERRNQLDRLEQEAEDFHLDVSDGFKDLKNDDPGRIRLVNTEGRHSDTAMAIFENLSDIFPWLTDGSVDLKDKLEAYDMQHIH